jgi:hypothetical protein
MFHLLELLAGDYSSPSAVASNCRVGKKGARSPSRSRWRTFIRDAFIQVRPVCGVALAATPTWVKVALPMFIELRRFEPDERDRLHDGFPHFGIDVAALTAHPDFVDSHAVDFIGQSPQCRPRNSE